MEAVQKALDTVVGANFERQDLSATLTILDGPPRPVTQYAPAIAAKGTIHYWNEQNLVKAGAGAATFPEGARPAADAVAPVRITNNVCQTGKTASVTDKEAAVWQGAGGYKLAEGELERMIQEAIDLQVELKTVEVLNEIEYMHLLGDSANSQNWTGGQCDGLAKWIRASGVVFAAGGSSSVTAAFTETGVRDGFRDIAKGFPTLLPNVGLVPPEVKETVNTFVGGGAGRPIVQVVTGNAGGMTGGAEVDKYQTGYGIIDIRIEPYLSPAYNPNITNKFALFYNTTQVKHADLIKLNAEPLARIGTSVERMVTCYYSQEHHIPKHTGVYDNIT